jgi:integrase
VEAPAHSTGVDAMDVALLTGRRPADLRKIRCTDIREGALWIVQNKTGARIGIEPANGLDARPTFRALRRTKLTEQDRTPSEYCDRWVTSSEAREQLNVFWRQPGRPPRPHPQRPSPKFRDPLFVRSKHARSI